MGQQTNEVKAAASAGARVKKASAAPVLAALALTAAGLAAGYAGRGAWAGSRTTFYPKETLGGVNVGGRTVPAGADPFRLPHPDCGGRGLAPRRRGGFHHPGGIGLHRRALSGHCPAVF